MAAKRQWRPRDRTAGFFQHRRVDTVTAGVLIALCGYLMFSISDVTAKVMTHQVSIVQVTLAQYIWMVLMALFLGSRQRIVTIARTAHPWLQTTRAVCSLGGSLLFYTALFYMPFADVVAIGFISPFFITALAWLVLGETVAPVRWLACAIGFLGAIIIIRPAFAEVGWPALLPIGATLNYATYAIVTRKIGPREGSATMLFYIGIVGVIVLAMALPFVWVAPTWMEWVGLAFIGLTAAAGHLADIKAYSLVPASLIAPFRYTSIISAVILGLIVFGDFPDLWTWLGAVIIMGSGLFAYRAEWRERE